MAKQKVVRRLRHEIHDEVVTVIAGMSPEDFAKLAQKILTRNQVNYAGETSLRQQMFEEVYPFGW